MDTAKIIEYEMKKYMKKLNKFLYNILVDHWNWDIGISEDSQASINPIEIQTCFSCKFIFFSCKS